ncbi:hypothetical protein [Sulfurimonas sp. NW9]|uniref:hypothetical protein n=1 Tax=Sulfurimonas sp. NW9 TaxID=2922728 RepID=UPI003DA8EA84
MEAIPIEALKILSDAKISYMEAINSNEDVFEYVKTTQNKGYSKDQVARLALYDIKDISKNLKSFKKNKSRNTYFYQTVDKNDRSLVLTELIIKGLYDDSSIGPRSALEVFAFTPKCLSCGESSELIYSCLPVDVPYRLTVDTSCKKCGHTNSVVKCNCEKCSEKWNGLIEHLKMFEPYFSNGYRIIIDTDDCNSCYELSSIDDIFSFIELIARGEIYGIEKFSLRDSK